MARRASLSSKSDSAPPKGTGGEGQSSFTTAETPIPLSTTTTRAHPQLDANCVCHAATPLVPILRLPDDGSIVRFPIPLPPGTDPHFKIDVSVDGVVGMQMSCPRRREQLNATIAGRVDGAARPMDCVFEPGMHMFVHRAFFSAEMHNIYPKLRTWTHKKPSTGFTFGHLLTILVQKQFVHWLALTSGGAVTGMTELGRLVGVDVAGESAGLLVAFESLYVVAVRCHTMDEGQTMWYFPQLEVQLPRGAQHGDANIQLFMSRARSTNRI